MSVVFKKMIIQIERYGYNAERQGLQNNSHMKGHRFFATIDQKVNTFIIWCVRKVCIGLFVFM